MGVHLSLSKIKFYQFGNEFRTFDKNKKSPPKECENHLL